MTEFDNHPRDSIQEALRQLPRVTASASFNRRLLERFTDPAAPAVPAWPRLVAACFLLTVLAGGLFLANQRSKRLDYQRQRAALERLHDDLRRDLAEVRERAGRSPRLYLGTASDVDVVLDLDPWMSQPTAQPASYTTSRP